MIDRGRRTALSRIGNWAEMDERERERVLRVLGKRNQIRLNDLRNGNGGTVEKEQAQEDQREVKQNPAS